MTVVTWQSGCSACHLRAFGLCQAVQDSRGAACLQSVRHPARFYPPGRTVFAQGSQNVPLHNVLSGWLFSYQLLPDGRRQILQFLLPGDIAGLEPEGAAGITHGLETLSEAVLCAIPRDGFHRLCARCPAVTERCRWMMARDVTLLFERLATLGRRMARERVVHLLMELAVRSSRTTQFADGTRLRMPLTQPIMADALGLTAIHINRVLRELRHEESWSSTTRR
ncbi:Crp/Fnr family transcriptional regulator [Fodinicurvata halophila]|uniref:Crp/Fnr family transcriptional regulator n=1 Tax=Fodinicurvata halophila TaxID=1419723 RepID=UPI003639DC2D